MAGMRRKRVASKWRDGRHWCPRCEDYLSPEMFSKSKGNASGLCNECKRCSVDRQLRINFCISLDEYEHMLDEQGGVCAICRNPEPISGRKLAVDHDHSCCPGKKTCGLCIRSLLCSDCNLMLGKARDEPDRLRAAANYLENYR